MDAANDLVLEDHEQDDWREYGENEPNQQHVFWHTLAGGDIKLGLALVH